MATDHTERGEFAGKTALITGASRGIGRETATQLVRGGARVVAVARASDDLSRLSAQLGSAFIPCAADLANEAETAMALETARAEIGVPDIIVNNAGAFYVAPFASAPLDEFKRSLSVNLQAPFQIVRAFLSEMVARGSGHIVTVGSVADRRIFPENAAYASTKFGLRALHEVLRAETQGSGVRATLVSPGPVDTRLWDDIDPDNREGFTPRESMLDPWSVADAICYTLTRPAHVDVEELRLSRS